MKRGHGAADRSIFLPQDAVSLQKIDEMIANGGRSAEAARRAAVNKFFGPNRFGKMFADLEPFRPPDDALEDLGRAMIETSPEDPALNTSDVPAGVTYLGQFIDHDLSFDKTELEGPIDDPDQMEQARTPTLELDSLYGLGPRLNPQFYEPHPPEPRAIFRIGRTSSIASSGGVGKPDVPVSLPNDLPRGDDKLAIIADERNDENTIVAQTHLAFLKFHNQVMAIGPQRGRGGPGTPFERTQRTVRWHYQWIVLHDFLPQIVDPTVLDDVRTNGRKFYRFNQRPFEGQAFMPLEFSAAAYRMGHSMIRESYNFNRVFAHQSVEPAALVEASLKLLFDFTGSGGFLPAPPGTHKALPSNWIIDWRRFFDVGSPQLLNFIRRIDTKLVPALHNLPGASPGRESLAVRNLLRGSRVGLPSGQDVAGAMNITALTPGQVASGDDGSVLQEHGLDERTPLWYYVLKEAEVQTGGRRLGEAGSRIVAEVFIGLLEGDATSFVAVEPNWKPTLPSVIPGDFTMADLLRFVNDLNPLGT